MLLKVKKNEENLCLRVLLVLFNTVYTNTKNTAQLHAK
jgi:hypothetical protein